MKNKTIQQKIKIVSLSSIAFFQLFAVRVFAQIKPVVVPQAQSQDDTAWWWYPTLIALVIGLCGAVIWWLKGKSAEKKELAKSNAARKEKEKDWESESLDADKELEWLRKNQIVLDSGHKKRKAKKSVLPDVLEISVGDAGAGAGSASEPDALPPVFGFQELLPSKPFSPLPLSNNESLLSAIEQAQEEDEEDEEIRDLAIRILAAFKNRNSVEALTQVALYDLSSSLRSKAVSTLADFDHESVFEPILMAAADPTREVRAAAARSLSRLDFDRADAWTRITETGEEGRMRHAARAAMEGGFVERSFERLVHADRKHAYEAFVLLALLIKAGEVKPIFEALKNHQDLNVKLAVLHLIKVVKNHNALDGLYALLEDKKLPPDIKEEVGKTIEEIGFVMA
ncbi:MAG: HEAT repeat domain-containing protein [Pyrinomonadaceae bacterium]